MIFLRTLIKLTVGIAVCIFISQAYAQTCSFKTQIKYLDGTTGCIEDLPIANQTADGDNLKLIDSINRSGNYAVARSKTPDCKSLGFSKGAAFHGNSSFRTASSLAMDICMNAGCDCEVIIANGQVLVDKESLLSGHSLTASMPALTKQVAIDEKQIQQELVKKQQLEKEQKALAEKTRLEAEKRLADDRRRQQELAKKEQFEKEQKIAEEKRTQLALVKQQELEKEQKVLAEKARLEQDLIKKAQLEIEQKVLAEKARLEADKQLAEAKRIQQEQAKQAQSDKELAEKTRIAKEKQLAEEKSSQTQLVRLQALEKENADLIARLQQEKVTASKALSDEARILALRKELEKEIRASIQNETSGAQGSSKPKQAPIFANRKALVIGNDAYKKVTPLLNAAEDAKVVAESLAALGFKVSLKLDVDRKQFQSEIRAFKNQVKAGDEVAIFYAGHGVQIASTNYLLPVDIAGQNEEEIRDDAISLQRILDDMTEKEAKFTLAMIDACRDNPFKSSGRSVIGTRGLAPTTAATGQMIVFSAGTGQQALDKLGPNDKSKNGLFTRVFVKEMQKAGVSVDRVVRNVRTEVVALAKSVGHNQVPAIYDQVVGEFYFKQ